MKRRATRDEEVGWLAVSERGGCETKRGVCVCVPNIAAASRPPSAPLRYWLCASVSRVGAADSMRGAGTAVDSRSTCVAHRNRSRSAVLTGEQRWLNGMDDGGLTRGQVALGGANHLCEPCRTHGLVHPLCPAPSPARSMVPLLSPTWHCFAPQDEQRHVWVDPPSTAMPTRSCSPIDTRVILGLSFDHAERSGRMGWACNHLRLAGAYRNGASTGRVLLRSVRLVTGAMRIGARVAMVLVRGTQARSGGEWSGSNTCWRAQSCKAGQSKDGGAYVESTATVVHTSGSMRGEGSRCAWTLPASARCRQRVAKPFCREEGERGEVLGGRRCTLFV